MNKQWIKRKIKNYLFKIFTASDLINLIENEKVDRCLRQVVSGNKTFFYPEAIVENILNDTSKIVIGEGTHIRGELTLYGYANQLKIGNNCYIGKWSVIRSGESIVIGDNVLIAHGVSIIDSDSHELNSEERAMSFYNMVNNGHSKVKGNVKTAPIIINDFVWLSYGVAVLKGVTIGEGAIVAAKSVVTKDVPAWTLVAGNPAKIVKELIKPD